MTEIDSKQDFERRCPVCGGDNQCAMAATPPLKDCWCRAVDIDPGLLAALPEASRGRACLCATCCRLKGDALER